MDSFEWNKIIGAILGTLIFVMGVGFIAEAVYHPIEGNGVGYALPMPEGTGEGAGQAEPEPVVPLPVLLADASAEDGATVARKCASCHNFGEGEPNKTGPGLYGVVGASIAAHDGFAYSDALAALSGETWTYERLDEFLASPKAAVPGTKMSFVGISDEEDRADLLAYLQSLAATPVPFPEVAAVEMPAEGEPAEGEAESAPAEGEPVGEPAPTGTVTPPADPTVTEPAVVPETQSDEPVPASPGSQN